MTTLFKKYSSSTSSCVCLSRRNPGVKWGLHVQDFHHVLRIGKKYSSSIEKCMFHCIKMFFHCTLLPREKKTGLKDEYILHWAILFKNGPNNFCLFAITFFYCYGYLIWNGKNRTQIFKATLSMRRHLDTGVSKCERWCFDEKAIMPNIERFVLSIKWKLISWTIDWCWYNIYRKYQKGDIYVWICLCDFILCQCVPNTEDKWIIWSSSTLFVISR